MLEVLKVSASMDLTKHNFQISFFSIIDEIAKLSQEEIYFHEQSRSDSPHNEIFLLVPQLLVLEC